MVSTQASARLAGQVALMCSSDARATGMLAGAATLAGLGCAIALGIKDNVPLQAGAIGVAVFSIFATLAALWAIWPVDVYLPGWKPSSFENDWARPEQDVLLDMLPILETTIANNDAVMERLLRRSLTAMLLIAGSPFAGVMCWGFWSGRPWGVVIALFCLGLICTVTFLHVVPESRRRPG